MSNFSAGKKKIVLFAFFASALAGMLVWSFVLRHQSESQPTLLPAAEARATADLGITYLSVTSESAAYYGLSIESGALVTDVAPGSPADRAGLKPGDIILSFNGARLSEKAPLIGMMMGYPAERAMLEVCRGNDTRVVELDCSE